MRHEYESACVLYLSVELLWLYFPCYTEVEIQTRFEADIWVSVGGCCREGGDMTEAVGEQLSILTLLVNTVHN